MSLRCRFCAWLCHKIGCDPEAEWTAFEAEVDRWERAHSNDWELSSQEPEELRALNERAGNLRESDPEESFRLRREAADGGSAWALQMMALRYHIGADVDPDFGQAQAYYRRAIAAGSQMATTLYARLLAKHGDYESAERILEDSVEADFIPAFYWLARFRHKRAKNREVARKIAPLVEHAAAAGHPGAQAFLPRMLLSGNLGLLGVPRGFKVLWTFVTRRAENDPSRQQGRLG